MGNVECGMEDGMTDSEFPACVVRVAAGRRIPNSALRLAIRRIA